ncbi:hypothetical protein [Propylenella binzhouense]|uniref:Uncharacterized protein n=1 Tax=Propylenella binzhouense TaxID=2555902 RepID=A0A964WUX8_9HYPH|nr:hypothetical protein [Propylenella binzhouense]MYZ49551.1 hypothetical protein [Propylenella binzhouense]
MSEVRSLVPGDIPAVARLFQKTFRDGSAPSPALEDHLAEIFLQHPWQDPELVSKVAAGADGVTGFIGVLPARMRFAGRTVRAAVAGSLMVEAPDADPTAGARLVRSFVSGPQELSITETANDLSRGLWDRLRGVTIPAGAFDWLKPLKPAGFLTALAAEVVPAFGPLRHLARPVDAPLAAWFGRGARRPAPSRRGARAVAPAGPAEFAEAVLSLARSYALAPDWDQGSLSWFLGQSEHKDRFGPTVRRIVVEPRGAEIGAFVYHGRPRGIARVLNLFASPGDEMRVVSALIEEARAAGHAGLRGRGDPRLLDALARHNAILFHRASLIVHSKDRALIDAIAAGDALVTGLAGETWARLVGDSVNKK